jgi:biopolymer transport protein ExbD
MGMTTKGPAGINVTPLIDVLLVLLIIFMVMLPRMLTMETIEVPPPCDGCIGELPPVVLKLNADLTVAVDDQPAVIGGELAAQLRSKVALTKTVLLQVDDGVPWSEVLATVDSVRGVAEDARHESIRIAVQMRP